MAGLFGFFDPTKEGPGISKNAPKKKAFFVFFETFFRNFFKFFSINLIYILVSAPIITHGMAHAGITNVTRNIARDKHSFGLSDFFETIKKNWKQSLAVGIINTIVTVLICFAVWFYNESYKQTAQTLSFLGLVLSLSVAAVFAIMNFYIYTLMITFDFSIKTLYKNSWLFATLGIKHNLIITGTLAVIFVLAYILLVLNFRIGLTIIIVVGAFIYPSFSAFLIQFNVFPEIKKYIIDPYYKEHPDEDIEKRRDLGLIEYEEESIFEDNGVEED